MGLILISDYYIMGRIVRLGEKLMKKNDLLTLSVETSNDLYKSGRANYLEVLLAQQNSLQTKVELINTNKRQRIATVIIYKALGGGWR